MNYVNYVENNNFFMVLPEYAEHNKENINLSNVNFDYSQFHPTHVSHHGENMTGEGKDNHKFTTNLSFGNNLNNKHGMANLDISFNKKENPIEKPNKLIDIVNKKYVNNKLAIKNMINGDHPNMNPQHITTRLQSSSDPNSQFNFSQSRIPEDYSKITHHNYPNKENLYMDENIQNNDINNLCYNDHSAFQSTDDNISMKKYYENSNVMKVKNIHPNSNSHYQSNIIQKNLKSCSIYDKHIAQIPHDFLFDIWESLKQEEQMNSICHDFMKNQSDINEKMRAILVDWLVEVHQRFNLTPETLFLTVNIIDRYISKREILRTQLQLVGVAALFIACKYEEILCPDIRDFVYITDKTYTKGEILQIERDILNTLNFDVCIPTCLRMFEIISLNFNFNEVEFTYGKYLLESFLIDSKCYKYFPSVISCAVAHIIMKMNSYQNYQDVYKILTCNQKTLKDCAKEIYYLTSNIEAIQFKAVHRKYSSGEYYFVATNCMGESGKN